MIDADVPGLQRIHASGTMSSYGAVLTWLKPIVEDPATPLEPADWTLCAVDEGRLVGYIAVTRRHIENLYVDPAAQRRHVGTQLLAAAEARVGERPLTLRCLTANPHARRFYERHGYVLAHTEVTRYHGRELEAWLMTKR